MTPPLQWRESFIVTERNREAEDDEEEDDESGEMDREEGEEEEEEEPELEPRHKSSGEAVNGICFGVPSVSQKKIRGSPTKQKDIVVGNTSMGFETVMLLLMEGLRLWLNTRRL